VLSEEETATVKSTFEQVTAGNKVECKALTPDDMPVLIVRPEFMRRMKEMQQLQGVGGMDFPDMFNVVVNTNHPLVAQKLAVNPDEAQRSAMAQYLYDLALLQQGMLRGEALTKFVDKTLEKVKSEK
jgi:molecular chaperone HtpG